MRAITLLDYLGRYGEHPDATPERRRAAFRWLDASVNPALLAAERDGVDLLINPLTACHIAGSGNGGFRPGDCPVGAARSGHKMPLIEGQLGVAIDIVDPTRELVAWSLANQARLEQLGILALEDPRWTPTWAHWQSFPVPSGRFAFIPSNDPPLAAAPAAWLPRRSLA